MSSYSFYYKPENLAFADKPVWVSSIDGDTPTLQLPIRMLGIDALEIHYAGATENNAGKYDTDMQGFLNNEVKNLDLSQGYLYAARWRTG